MLMIYEIRLVRKHIDMIEKLRGIVHNRTAISILLSLFVFQLISGLFVPRYNITDMNIRIEATGEKNISSKSNGVQIKSVLVDNTKKVLPKDFFGDTSWLHGEDEYLTWVEYKAMSNSISAKGEFRSLRISLTKEEYSGKAKVYANDKLIKEVDLYSERPGTVLVNINGNGSSSALVYFLKLFALFALIFAIAYISCYFYQKSIKYTDVQLMIVYSFGVSVAMVYIICISRSAELLMTIGCGISIFGLISIICTQLIDVRRFIGFVNKKYRKVIFSFVVLACIIVPIWHTLNENKIIEEKIENTTDDVSEISLTSGVGLKQYVSNLLGKPGKLDIKIENRSDNEGSFTIYAIQNERKIEWDIQGIDCNDKDFITLDLTSLQPGDFLLNIDAKEGSTDKSVRLLSSGDKRFGKLEYNNTTNNNNLCMSLDISKEYIFHKQQLALFTTLVVTLLIAIGNVIYYDNDIVTFILVSIAAFLAYCIRYPMYFLDAQPILESGSNFFLQTYERGFEKSLFLEDFVYWPLFTRLLSDVVVFLFKQRKMAMLSINIIGWLVVILNCSMINLKVFRLNLSKYERFVLSLIFGFVPLFSIGELICFHDSSYWNFIFVTLFLTVDWKQIKGYKYFLVILSTLMLISKIVFTVMLPVYIVILAFIVLTKQVKYKKSFIIYLIVSIFMSLSSIIYSYILLNKLSYFRGEDGTFAERILYIIRQTPLYYYRALYSPMETVFKTQNIDSYIAVVLLIIITVFAFMWIASNGIKKYLKSSNIEGARDELIMLFYLLLSIATASFLLYTNKDLAFTTNNLYVEDFVFERKNFIIVVEFMIFLTMFLKYTFKNKNVALIVPICIMAMLMLVPFNIDITSTTLANWSKQYKELYRSSYAIPVADGPDFFLLKNSFVGYIGGDNNRFTGEYSYMYTAKTIKEIDSSRVVYSLDMSDIDKVQNRNILEIYARKSAILQSPESYVLVKDKNGEVIAKVDALFSKDRQALSYILPDGIKNIGSLEFYYSKDNAPYPLLPEVYLGIEGEYEE